MRDPPQNVGAMSRSRVARPLYTRRSGAIEHGRQGRKVLALWTRCRVSRGYAAASPLRNPGPPRVSREWPPLRRDAARRTRRRDLLLADALQNVTGSVFSPRSVRLWRYSGRSVASARFGSLRTSVLIAI